MWIAHDYRVARRGSGTAVAIGNFDGVHRGHREILRRALEGARSHKVDAVVLTFEPHPTRILAPERASPLLTGLDRKLELIAEARLDAPHPMRVACTVVQMFDRKFSAQNPREFAREVLMGLRAREVYVGEDFHFGKDRAGNGKVLAELGREMGFEAIIVPPVVHGHASISSSRVRHALAEGDLEGAGELLGRRFDIDGLVVEGDRRGRLLGFPTANLRTAVEALPKDGVYAVWTRVLAGENERWMRGVMNIGVRPTFAAGRSIEVHLLDVSRELYGATLRVECVARVRDEVRFEGIEALRAQIARDVERARALLGTEER
jgi:riboflavin kinase/FMN adenylyltransferase